MDYKAIYMGMTGTVKTLLGGGPFKLLGTGLMVLLFHQHYFLKFFQLEDVCRLYSLKYK